MPRAAARNKRHNIRFKCSILLFMRGSKADKALPALRGGRLLRNRAVPLSCRRAAAASLIPHSPWPIRSVPAVDTDCPFHPADTLRRVDVIPSTGRKSIRFLIQASYKAPVNPWRVPGRISCINFFQSVRQLPGSIERRNASLMVPVWQPRSLRIDSASIF